MSKYTTPNPDYPPELIDRLKLLMSDKIIREIARSDYGADAPEHNKAIRRIISEDRIPRPMEWEPGEPIRLTRWWSPEHHKKHEIRALSIDEAHIARAFSCACLLACASDGRDETYDSLPGLIESCYTIEPGLLLPAISLIDWVTRHNLRIPYDISCFDHDEIVCSSCAKLIISCMLRLDTEPVISILESLQNCFQNIHDYEKKYQGRVIHERDHWIYTSVLNHCTARKEWSKLAKQWLLSPPDHWDSDTQHAVVGVGTKMLPQSWVSKIIPRHS